MRRLGLVAALCGASLLAGCSGSFSGINPTENTQPGTGSPGARLTGTVHGGQNPISGAHVYLFAAASGASGAGQAAYGGSGIAASTSNASQSLLNAASTGHSDSLGAYVPTGSDGSFSISGDYTCTSGQQVYVYALGGDPGLGTGANPAAALMAALGTCPGTTGSTGNTFSSGLSVMVNEVSTVAAAYAMAGFATDATHVGSSGTPLAQTGIANAFANAANLETIGTGVALATTPAGNGTVPQAEINTLANILAACVNSNGTGSACTTLFANAKSGGTTGTLAADTATATINIAHSPGAGVAALYGLASGTAPFTPELSAAPNDWTIALNYAGTGIGANNAAALSAIAIDAAGNAWITIPVRGEVTELSPLGVLLSSPYGYSASLGPWQPTAVAIDRSDNAWITSGGLLYEMSSTGSVLNGNSGYLTGGSDGKSVSIDGSGNIWVLDYSVSSEFELTSAGVSLAPAGGFRYPLPVTGQAIDGSGNVWSPGQGFQPHEYTVTKMSHSGTLLSGNGYNTGIQGGLAPGIAIDSGGNVWVAGSSVAKLSNAGVVVSQTPFFVYPSTALPVDITLDGSGNVWIATGQLIGAPSTSDLTEASNTGAILSAANGYASIMTNSQGDSTCGVAIDGSGDAWVLHCGDGGFYYSASVNEYIGVATPVITPIAAGLPATPTADGSSNLGTRP